MASSVVIGRPEITVINDTCHAIWVAVYKRSLLRVSEPPIVWQVASPPPRGKTAVFVPREYQVCARYSLEPESPGRPVYQTNVLQVPHAPAGASLGIEGVSAPDRRAWGAVLTRTAESPGWYRLRVVNRSLIGVWCHVRQDGRDIFSPRILPPMAVFSERLDSPLYVAVLALPRMAGDLLSDSEIGLTEIAVHPGESVRIQGGPFEGFKTSRVTDKKTGQESEIKSGMGSVAPDPNPEPSA